MFVLIVNNKIYFGTFDVVILIKLWYLAISSCTIAFWNNNNFPSPSSPNISYGQIPSEIQKLSLSEHFL